MDFDFTTESITPNSVTILKISSTGALDLPSGTTAQRPGGVIAGAMRWNSDTPGIEYYSGSAWGAIGSGGSGVSSFSGGTTGFTPNTATTGVVTLAGTLVVGNGGTGLSSLTANYIPYGNGTSALQSSASLQFDGTTMRLGSASLLGGATNPILGITGAANNYIQSYIYNTTNGTSASSDVITYPSNGVDAHGWTDMGITSQAYADATYTVTGPNESYLFGSAPSGAGVTGNLVYATDSTGSANSHQWYVGGFTQSKSAWKMQLTSTGLQLASALPVGSGGTGLATLTANYIPYGNGTSALQTNVNLQYDGTTLRVGSQALLGGATNPVLGVTGSANSYIQSYIYNAANNASSSADFVAYPNNGADTHGWADLGITSLTYADTTYTVTGPNEAYLMGSAPSGAGVTGNLVYATDSTGSANAHQWYIGGFTQAKSAYKMQLGTAGLDLKTAITLTGSAGTSGQVLTSAGAGATPTWTTGGGSGGVSMADVLKIASLRL